MEGLVLHGAAHVFFENKLGELEAHINSKFKKLETKFKQEMKEIFKYQQNEISKLKYDVNDLKEEIKVIKQSEETITHKGMTKISKLSKEVKTELNEIKKLKTDVNGLKKDVIGIRQSEEDLSKMGMDKLAKLSEEFKTEVKQIKTDMRGVKKDIAAVKEANKKKSEVSEDDNTSGQIDIVEPDKAKQPRKRNNSYREPKIPSTIVEMLHSSEEETDKKVSAGAGAIPKIRDNIPVNGVAAAETNNNQQEEKILENGVLQSFGGADYEDNYMKNFNDDHIRKLVFSSQESSDYHHESSDYHESDAVSDEEQSGHLDKTFNVKRIFSRKFLYK